MPRSRWDTEKFSEKLEKAAEAYDRAEVQALCEELIAHIYQRTDKEPYAARAAKRDLYALRRKRYFDLMLRVADALIRSGQTEPQIRRQYAQALLDTGQVSAALTVLRGIQAEDTVSAKELAEARGLMGRAYKQMYVDSDSPRSPAFRARLQSAVDIYAAVYGSDPGEYLWHGINAASLLWRGDNDGSSVTSDQDAQEIAKAVLATIEDRENARTATMWDIATAAEAAVVLEDYASAAKYLEKYVVFDHADAFELASTLRQFEQVLLLDQKIAEEAVLLDLLRGALLKSGGGTLDTRPEIFGREEEARSRVANLEALLGNKYQHHSWLLKGIERARGVGRIRRNYRGKGTCFLVPGQLLSDEWAGRQVLVTNNHVVSAEPLLPQTLAPEEVTITFDALEWGAGPEPDFESLPKYKIERILWESPIPNLDTTVCVLNERVDGIQDYELAASMPRTDREDRVYIIGHPKGDELAYSLQNNFLLGLNAKRIHYRSPTERGSSGSPLFNDAWELIGIHHGGGEDMPQLGNPGAEYEANEGIPIGAIKNAMRT